MGINIIVCGCSAPEAVDAETVNERRSKENESCRLELQQLFF